MKLIDVKNKKGTSSNTPPTGFTSWLNFWEVNKKSTATLCKAYNCKNRSDVGGHVIKAGEGGKEYILPLCHSHNNGTENEIFKAWEGDLVSVVV